MSIFRHDDSPKSLGRLAKYDYNNPAFSSATGHFTQVSDPYPCWCFRIMLIPPCAIDGLEVHHGTRLRPRLVRSQHFIPSLCKLALPFLNRHGADDAFSFRSLRAAT